MLVYVYMYDYIIDYLLKTYYCTYLYLLTYLLTTRTCIRNEKDKDVTHIPVDENFPNMTRNLFHE